MGGAPDSTPDVVQAPAAGSVDTLTAVAHDTDREGPPDGGAGRNRPQAPIHPVLDASPNAIVAVDRAARISYANPSIESTFGYRPDELLGEPIERLIPDRIGARHVGHRTAYVRHPQVRPMGIGLDLAGRRKDGSEFPVEISLTPVGAGDELEVFAEIIDISARKAAEDDLAASERRFRTVLEASPNAIVAVDEAGTISYANPQVQRAFGYQPDELLGQPITMLLPDRVRDRHDGHVSRFVRQPLARPMGIGLDLAGRRRDGSEFPVEISLSPVQTPTGLQVFATVVDISARKAAESHLLQSQKLESIGRLAGGIAHDFNNMLFAIRGYAELLEGDMASLTGPSTDLDAARTSVDAIASAADRATALTSQLLAFGRRQVVSPVVIDVKDAVRGLQPMLRQVIGEDIDLQFELDAATGRIVIDPGQFDQILVNLVVNARDAMPDGGRMAVGTANQYFDEPFAMEHFEVTVGHYVMLSVSDTGIGMDREVREHIFEPFFTTKELGRGTGLGLATIYGIVRQAGGHIWLYSEPGQGSVFKVYLPRVEAPSAAVVPAQPIRGGESGTVLVVEDEALVRTMTTRLLERAGFQVTAVADASEALARLSGMPAPPDVLVSDMVMPATSGLELAEQVIARYPRVGVVLLSGYTPETFDIDRVHRLGAEFVAKPVSSAQLVDAVRAARAAVATRA